MIEKAGPGAVETLQADVRRYDEVERAIAATVTRFGGLDILINNAGVGIFANVADMTPAEWSEVIDTNLTGVFNGCRAAHPAPAAAGRRLHRQHQQSGGQECVPHRRPRTARPNPA